MQENIYLLWKLYYIVYREYYYYYVTYIKIVLYLQFHSG